MENRKFGGVYLLYKDNKCVYVGSSSNIPMRINTHVREGEKEFDYFIGVKSDGYIDLEKYLIRKYFPDNNKYIPMISKKMRETADVAFAPNRNLDELIHLYFMSEKEYYEVHEVMREIFHCCSHSGFLYEDLTGHRVPILDNVWLLIAIRNNLNFGGLGFCDYRTEEDSLSYIILKSDFDRNKEQIRRAILYGELFTIERNDANEIILKSVGFVTDEMWNKPERDRQILSQQSSLYRTNQYPKTHLNIYEIRKIIGEQDENGRDGFIPEDLMIRYFYLMNIVKDNIDTRGENYGR